MHSCHSKRRSHVSRSSALLLAVALTLLPSLPAAEAGLIPSDLRCELMTDPLGIDVPYPRLSWVLRSDARGQVQLAYQVQAASSRELLVSGRPDLWDSGRVASDATLGVPYAGRALGSSEQAFWRVRVWDRGGHVSKWSPLAKWVMGVVEGKGWDEGTHWITDPALLRWVRKAIGFRSADAASADTVKWVQVDLGAVHPIERVRLHAIRHTVAELLGFPLRLKLEAAENAEFRNAVTVVDYTDREIPRTKAALIELPCGDVKARVLRLTATRLRIVNSTVCLALSQIEVIAGGRNVASGAAVSASDSVELAPWASASLTDGLGVPGANPRASDTLLVRREFRLRSKVRRAIAHVTGLGQYEFFVNGTRLNRGLMSPGWTDVRKTCLYDTYDLTGLLRSGANAAGFRLAGGPYSVQEGRYVKFVSAFRPLVAFGEILVEYADGTSETVITDGRWRVFPGPTTFSNFYGGEDFDARREPAGWSLPGFDDRAWTPAAETGGPGGVLRGVTHASPPFGRFETLKPVAVHELRPGTRVYDFGQNASMMPHLRVRGAPGAVVKMVPAELVTPDGSVDRRSAGGGDAWWSYTLAGNPEGEEWFPSFFYHGSRYLQVELTAPAGAPPPEVQGLEATVVHSDSPPAGDFSCSNELFNRIRVLVRWAQRSNLAHVITDCPHREKLGWLEQYHLNGPSLRYEFDLTRLYGKTFADMADAQQPSGLVPDIAPEYVVFTGGFRDSPEWGGAVVLAAWQHLLWTGDDTPLRRYYPRMQRYVAYLASRSDGQIVSHGLGDWFDIGPGSPGTSQLTPIPLTATAIYYECTSALSRIAAHLGKAADAKEYQRQAEQIADAFNRRFLDPGKGVYASGSQTAQAMPLVLGLVPPEQRGSVLEALVKDVRDRGNAPTSGDVGYRYLLRALAGGGRSDVIFDMNHQSEKPGYGYQLRRGATTLTEAWDAAPGTSQNHFMLGQIIEWFYHDLVGIQPDEIGPGFKKIVIRPTPAGNVMWVKASYATARGTIHVGWRRDAGAFACDVTIPPNTTATIFLPAADSAAVREGGRSIAESPGVKLLRTEPGLAVFTVESGAYSFSVP
jgi:alpha-L-rhamnosidase